MIKKVDGEQLQKIAHLARLQLTPEELPTLTQQLNSILNYVEQLNQLDTESIDPTAHISNLTRTFRSDTPAPMPNTEGLLRNAPQRQGQLFTVPKVIETN